jgi:ketosteroid isomerase-like protein
MYKAIVRRILRAGFRALSAGDYEHVLRQCHPQVMFSFAGPAPLGGERRGVEDVRTWFQRVSSYFPGIQFTAQDVIFRDGPGIPW